MVQILSIHVLVPRSMSRSKLLADVTGVAEERRVDDDREEEQQKVKPSVADLWVSWCTRALMASVWISC